MRRHKQIHQLATDRILPFVYVSPAFPEASVAEIDRCIEQHGFVGIKLWVARRATDPGLDPIMQAAARHAVPVLQHAWLKTSGNLPHESTPADVADLARRHPQVNIIMAHLNGCGLRGIEEVADTPNVVVDTSGGDPDSGLVEAAVATLGRHRVVYGSDAPVRHFGVSIGKVMGANTSATSLSEHHAPRPGLRGRILRLSKIGDPEASEGDVPVTPPPRKHPEAGAGPH